MVRLRKAGSTLIPPASRCKERKKGKDMLPGIISIGDPRLATVQHPMITSVLGSGAGGASVTTVAGLGQHETTHFLP